jgi:nitrite reductase (NADH) large subunit
MVRAGHVQAWRIGQVVGLVSGLAVVAVLAWAPDRGLDLFWNVFVPILPALFLVNPRIWRNLCPLASLNQLSGSRWGTLRPDARLSRRMGLVGVALFFFLVPARHVLFNTSGVAAAVVVGLLAILAFVMGMFFATRAGFCNTLCPVLPIERLYGHSPLVRVDAARCATCSLCTGAGCVDLTPDKSVAQTLGPGRKSTRWPLRPFGAFAAAMPGLVVGYFTTLDGGLSTVGAVYAHVWAWAALSFVVTAAVMIVTRVPYRTGILLLAGLAAALFYWNVAPSIAEATGGGPTVALVLRTATLALVALWVSRGLGQSGERRRSVGT